MIYLKKYNEDLRFLTELGKLLSKEDFNKYANEFDLIIEPFFEYADAGYKLSFETAYGAAVRMSYEDYNNKNETYKEFIHGLPALGLFFTSQIILKYDYKSLLNLLEDVQASIDRLGDIGWYIVEFRVNAYCETKMVNANTIVVSHKFKKDKV